MRLARLAWIYLWARPLVSVLNLALLALGLGAFTFVLLAGDQVEASLRRDVAGIDLVVGAKGSPLQIMLAGVYHLDVPSGNIPLSALDLLASHPAVAQVVPLSLGDSLRGHRIVGTTPDYAALYGATLSAGRWWSPDGGVLEVVLGATAARATGLKIGDRVPGSHGLGEGGALHADQPYTVVGVLKPTGAVIDRLVLTATASVWAVHAPEGHGAGLPVPLGSRPVIAAPAAPESSAASSASASASAAAQGAEAPALPRELTMLLVRYRSPLAAVSLPRWVNAHPGLQAAAPAMETARLLRLVGVGVDVLRGFGWVLLAASALSVFVALVHAVREREADLALMRLLGATPRRVAALVAAEALWLAALGSVLGLLIGHGLTEVLGRVLAAQQSLPLTGAWWAPGEAALPLLALGLALAAAAWPVWRAYRADVTALLQGAG